MAISRKELNVIRKIKKSYNGDYNNVISQLANNDYCREPLGSYVYDVYNDGVFKGVTITCICLLGISMAIKTIRYKKHFKDQFDKCNKINIKK